MSTQKITLNVANMHCPSCPKLITMDLEDLKGVKSVNASLEEKTVTVEFDPTETTAQLIFQTIESSGYTPKLHS